MTFSQPAGRYRQIETVGRGVQIERNGLDLAVGHHRRLGSLGSRRWRRLRRLAAGGKGKRGSDTAAAAAIGKLIAERAIEKGVKDVVFDRGEYIYHGRVKALAEAAREAGLNF